MRFIHLYKYIYSLLLVALLASCGGHSHDISPSSREVSLSRDIAELRYKDASLLDTLGTELLALARDNNEMKMVALNAKAYSALMKMDYVYAVELYKSVVDSSSCEIERLVADVGLMTISYRTSRNREFFDYRARALDRIARINEDVEYLSDADRERFFSAKIEFGIVSICYFSSLSMLKEKNESLEFLKLNAGKTTNEHLKIYAGMIIANNDGDALQRLCLLYEGLQDARNEKVSWLEANYGLLLAISLRDSTVLNGWNSVEPRMVDMLAPDSVGFYDIPLYLADCAIEGFDAHGDYYMKIEAMTVKASCHTQKGEYEKALDILDSNALYEINDYYNYFYPNTINETRSLINVDADYALVNGSIDSLYNIPECILSVRREASCAFAGLGDSYWMNNRDAYVELVKKTRNNMLYESRVSIVEANIPKLRWFSIASILLLWVVSVSVMLYYKRRKRYEKIYSARLKHLQVVSRQLISSLPQELVDKERLCSHISSLLCDNFSDLQSRMKFSISLPLACDGEFGNLYEFELRYIDGTSDMLYVATTVPLGNEGYALLALLVPHVAVAIEEGMRLVSISDEQERVEEQHKAYALYLAEHKRENLLKRVSVSVVMSMRPFMDRVMNELRALPATEDVGDAERKLRYVAELTDRLDDLNVILERWIKMRQGELNLKIENFSLNELFSIIEKSSMRLRTKGVDLSVAGGSAVVKADRALTLFMINTLVDNASKFTPSGGSVSLGAVEGDGYVEIAVEDTGVGISQTDIDRILGEKVYDASSIGTDNDMLPKKSKGGGFGLMNCKGIIEKYKKTDEMFSVCSMGIESAKGKGSRFFFRLPKGVVKCIVVLLSLFPASLFAKDPTLVDLKAHADSVYAKNVEHDYESAIREARHALGILNEYYVAQTGGSDTLVLERGNAAELRWWRDGLFASDDELISDVYHNIIDLRNEISIAAMALKDWDLYRYNNYIFITLYTNVHESKGLVEKYDSARQEVAVYEAIIALSCFLIFILVAYCLVSYMRHNIVQRNDEQLMIELNRRLLDIAAIEERLSGDELLQRIADEIYGSLEESMRIKKLTISLRPAADAARIDATSPVNVGLDRNDIFINGVIESGKPFLSRDGMLRVLPLMVNADGEPLIVGALKIVTARPLSSDEVIAIELVAGYAASVAHHAIGRVAMGYMALEEVAEETERMKYEENRLHVQNMVMDNCLSVIKHETIYYPSRIRELANRAIADISGRDSSVTEMRELMEYYSSIFGILSNCAKRELDDSGFSVSRVQLKSIFASMQRYTARRAAKKGIDLKLDFEPTELEVSVDTDLVEFLFESLVEASFACTKPGHLLLRAVDSHETVRIELVDNRRTIESQKVAEMFAPSGYNINSEGGVDGMEYLVAKEIIRLHEDITGKRGGRIEARSDVSGTVIMFALLK